MENERNYGLVTRRTTVEKLGKLEELVEQEELWRGN